jgi:AraC-like DNA-binding protein
VQTEQIRTPLLYYCPFVLHFLDLGISIFILWQLRPYLSIISNFYTIAMFLFLDSFIAGGIALLGFTILTNPREVNVLGNRLLAILLFLVAILVFDKGLFDSHFYETHIDLLGFTDMFLYFTAPTLYLSVVYFVSLDKTFNKKDLGHYVLPVLLLPVFIYAIFQSPETKLDTLNSSIYDLVHLLLLIQAIVYWVLAYLKLEKHRKNIQIFAASTDEIDLSWLKNFLLGIAGMIAISFAEFYFNNILMFKYASVGYLIATYILSYFALRQNEVFALDIKEREEIKDIIEEQNPIQKQERLSETAITPLKIRLMTLMESEKVYLDEALNLPKLADKMDISTHDMSYLLNDGFGQSFFQFVNNYRVEEAKRLLMSEKHGHFNMLGIAYASGFSSKTTFNTTFKKLTQQSPSDFKPEQKKNGSVTLPPLFSSEKS